jgi:hypothetical protein
MKRVIYAGFLEATSLALNICVKRGWWKLVKLLIEFRKAKIAAVLRRSTAIL